MILDKFSVRTFATACLCFIIGVSTCGTVLGSSLTWTVSGTYDDGRSLSGTFDYDAATQVVSGWNLTGASSFNYTPADSGFTSGACCTDQFAFIFTTFDAALSLEFAFNPDLTNGGGTSTIAGGSETFQLTDKPPVIVTLLAGSATTSPSSPNPPPQPPPPGNATPEPGTLSYASLASGLALVTLVRYRRRSMRNS